MKRMPGGGGGWGVCVGGGGGYFHTYVDSGHFLGFKKFEFQYSWGLSEK